MAASNFLNPYIAFTFLWSMFILCLTIYFIINAGDSFDAPPEKLDPETMLIWNRLIHFNFGWIGIQILFGLAHVLTICDSGRKTNEQVRPAKLPALPCLLVLLRHIPPSLSVSLIPEAEASNFQKGCTLYR